MGAPTSWVLLPLGVLLFLGAPSLGAPIPWLLLSHRVPLPLRFVFVLVELLVAVNGKRPNSPGKAYLRARVAAKLAVIVTMWP